MCVRPAACGQDPLDPLDPADPVDPLENSPKHVFGVIYNTLVDFGENGSQKGSGRLWGLCWARGGPGELWGASGRALGSLWESPGGALGGSGRLWGALGSSGRLYSELTKHVKELM